MGCVEVLAVMQPIRSQLRALIFLERLGMQEWAIDARVVLPKRSSIMQAKAGNKR